MIIQILTLLGIIAAVVGVPWHLRGRFDSLKQSLDRLERGQLQVTKLSNGLLGLVGLVIDLLHNRKSLSDEELHTVLAKYAEMVRIPEVGGTPLMADIKKVIFPLLCHNYGLTSPLPAATVSPLEGSERTSS